MNLAGLVALVSGALPSPLIAQGNQYEAVSSRAPIVSSMESTFNRRVLFIYPVLATAAVVCFTVKVAVECVIGLGHRHSIRPLGLDTAIIFREL